MGKWAEGRRGEADGDNSMAKGKSLLEGNNELSTRERETGTCNCNTLQVAELTWLTLAACN